MSEPLTITLRRSYLDECTLGILETPERHYGIIERPWRNNEPRVSCIPEGRYWVVQRRFNRGGYMALHITGVPGRSYILIHRGNYVENVIGCLAIGLKLAPLSDRYAVHDSEKALDEFLAWFKENEQPHKPGGQPGMWLKIKTRTGGKIV